MYLSYYFFTCGDLIPIFVVSVCKSIKSWLDSEPLHVAVVHCKGGKGRTGCVIAAFMHYTEICHRYIL